MNTFIWADVTKPSSLPKWNIPRGRRPHRSKTHISHHAAIALWCPRGKRGGDRLDINDVQLRCAQKALCEVNTWRRPPKGAHDCQVIERGLSGAGGLQCPCHDCSPPSSVGGCVEILQTRCQRSLMFHLISSCPVLSQRSFSWKVRL